MSHDESISDLHQRLDDLERRLAEKEAEISIPGAIPSHHRERIDEIYAKARATREKLLGSEESTWDAMKDELKADWEALTASFEHWVKHVDEEYRSRNP